MKVTDYTATLPSGASVWIADTANRTVILDNTSQSELTLAKLMGQMSVQHNFPEPIYAGVIVHLSDVAGNYIDSSLGNVSGAVLQQTLDKWKDYVWITDFQLQGNGTDRPLKLFDFDAGTARTLKVGQKIAMTFLYCTQSAPAGKVVKVLGDLNGWYFDKALDASNTRKTLLKHLNRPLGQEGLSLRPQGNLSE